MSFEVSKAVRDQAVKCKYKLSCLAEGICPGCEFESPISESLIFVQPKQADRDCAYITSYGKGHVCSCPVRCEIHRKYNK